MDKIRYGIIGSGMMGCEHVRNIEAIADAEVVAVADPHEESRNFGRLSCGDRKDEVRAYPDYREMLAQEAVDAVVVASPNHTHVDVMAELFELGRERSLHILLEKPMCTTLEACHQVVTGAASYPGVVQVGLEYRYMPPIAQFLRELPAVGEVKMLFIREHRYPFLPKVGNWNRFNRNTGGTLVEKCCHFFDLMNLVMPSKPVRVYASGGQSVNHLDERYEGETPDILDNAFVVVDWEDGARSCLDLCMFAESSRNEQEIVATGSKGKLDVVVPDGTLVRGGREFRKWEQVPSEEDPRIAHTGYHHGASYIEHLVFLEAIRKGTGPEVTVQDGLASVALGVAAHRSLESGQPVEMASLA